MSDLLWRYFWHNDVERFQRLLASSRYSSGYPSMPKSAGGSNTSPAGTPLGPGASLSSRTPHASKSWLKTSGGGMPLSRAEVNSRDYAGLTVLLRAAESKSPNALCFTRALLDHPATDIYVQDPENGWNALHRALYAGNISIARMLLDRERKHITGQTQTISGSLAVRSVVLIKTKDHEGNSPIELYNSTISGWAPVASSSPRQSDGDPEGVALREDLDMDFHGPECNHVARPGALAGDEIFVFGSNKNHSLGTGDEDDRQFPERILLKRPETILRRLYADYPSKSLLGSVSTSRGPDQIEIPFRIQSRPLIITDVSMSKFHTAIVTSDPWSNLYVAGVGRGGRLGLGDENTQFRFVPVQGALGSKCVRKVALGQNHTMAIVDSGELWTWGINSDAQLGYMLPPPDRSEDDLFSAAPRQVFGPLKKDIVLGIAASVHHSVAHTGTSLYCWGRNVGQLGLMDSDSESLEMQHSPRKVATAASMFPALISVVSAIEKATIYLLENHSVCVFTNYGHNFIKFPSSDVLANQALSAFSYSNRYDPARSKIGGLTSGGDTIAAVTRGGDLWTMAVRDSITKRKPTSSTTNPVKTRNAVTAPQCVWRSQQDGIASVSVGENGSVIISTTSGAAWRKVERAKAFDHTYGGGAAKGKGFKFQRVPTVTNVVGVRSSTFGAFAAIGRDCDHIRRKIEVGKQTLWQEVGSLLPIRDYPSPQAGSAVEPCTASSEKMGSLAVHIMRTNDIESSIQQYLASVPTIEACIQVCTSLHPNSKLPIHPWLIAARSPVLRMALAEAQETGVHESSKLFRIDTTAGSKMVMVFVGVDFLTLLNLVVFAYTDNTVPVWAWTQHAPHLNFRYRQIRTEVMNLASTLDIPSLEVAARSLSEPPRSLDNDIRRALDDPYFFSNADVTVELEDGDMFLHSSLASLGCPFFYGLFHGRSGGLWISHRRAASKPVKVDLKHVYSRVFRFVRTHLYTDNGPEMFDHIVASGFDDFSDLVMEVMSIANELMLDRLSQICQHVMGSFANTRNVASLLNEISPCSVTDFKQATLEYICIQMEAMLENHLLDELDEDILHELDHEVRQAQLACSPISRGGVAEAMLSEKYPSLADDIEEERQRRVRDMAFKLQQREIDKKLASSRKSRVGSLGESVQAPPTSSEWTRNMLSPKESCTPELRSNISQRDLIFAMDDKKKADLPRLDSGGGTKLQEANKNSSLSPRASEMERSAVAVGLEDNTHASNTPDTSRPSDPWGQNSRQSTAVGLRDIMSQTSAESPQRLTGKEGAAFTSWRAKEDPTRPLHARISQRERMKQRQMDILETTETEVEPRKWAWQQVGAQKSRAGRNEPDDVGKAEAGPSSSPKQPPQNPGATESFITRGAYGAGIPDMRFSGPKTPRSTPLSFTPHSKQYIPRPPKLEVGHELFNMSDIIQQQKQEQEFALKATEKRSLEEIQREQEFLEWWDQEEKKIKERGESRATKKFNGADKLGRWRGGKGHGHDRGRGNNLGGDSGNGGQIYDDKPDKGKTRAREVEKAASTAPSDRRSCLGARISKKSSPTRPDRGKRE